MPRKSKDITIEGVKELQAKLKHIALVAREKINKRALNFATTVVVKQAKSNAPKDSGQLEKAIGKRYKAYGNASGAVVIGARLGFGTTYKGKPRDPFYYSHLVELGFTNNKGIKIPADPFLRPAFDSNKQNIKNRYGKKAWKLIENLAKGGKKK